jgi:hypothetical protein
MGGWRRRRGDGRKRRGRGRNVMKMMAIKLAIKVTKWNTSIDIFISKLLSFSLPVIC